jgi:hypothetical protein
MIHLVICLLISVASASYAGEGKKINKSRTQKKAEEVKLCDTVRNISDIFFVNPYDNKSMCFDFMGTNVQLLSKHDALFSAFSGNQPVAFMHFEDQSAPKIFGGVVKGDGAYEYVTVTGSLNIIHKFKIAPQADLDNISKIKDIEIQKKEDRYNRVVDCWKTINNNSCNEIK